ncbi:MAG: hypothetical protein ACHQ51_08235 [Elusimicrobiota bacterium]
MIRFLTALSLLISMPGPSAWAAVVEVKLSAASFAAEPGAGARMPAVMPLGSLPARGAPSAAISSPMSAPAQAPSAAATVAATLAAPAPALAALPAAAATLLKALMAPPGAPSKTSAAAPVARAVLAATALPAVKDPAPEQNSAEADAAFDGRRVFLTGLGRTPRSVLVSELSAVLAADPAYRAALLRSGKIRAILPQSAGSNAEKRAAAAELGVFLKTLGIKSKPEIETVAPPRKTPAAEKAGAPAEAPAKDANEAVFLARQLRASVTMPSRAEFMGGLFTRVPFIAINVLAFAPLYLPRHPVAFAAIAGLTIGLKTFHSFWVDGWAAFQNRLARLRGIPYLTGFNLVYGQIVAAIYRTISWTALKGIVPPWTLQYWRDMGIVTLIGTFIGTLASQGVNELYEKGVLSRNGRSFFLLTRALVLDADGYFFKTGLMGSFWIIFGIHQALDFLLYVVSVKMKPRAVLYFASEEIAASNEFRALYPVSPGNARPSALSQALDAVRKNPLVALIGKLFRRHEPDVVRAYDRALTDPSLTDASVLSKIARVTPKLDAAGYALPATREGGISVPVLADDAAGNRVVFKPIRMSPQDPLYPYERMKLLREVVGSAVMRRFGVPTVDYRLGRAMLDGREVLGVYSAFIEVRSPAAGSAEEDMLSRSDAFARGSVVDAWMGNTDRILNRGNLWIRGVEGAAETVFGDFDQAFRSGASVLGVPKMPLAFHERFMSSDSAKRTVAEIGALDDITIRKLVDEALKSAGGFGKDSRGYLTAVLTGNRDLLRAGALNAVPGGPRVTLSPKASEILADAVLKDTTRAPGTEEQLDEALRDVVYLWTHPELRGLTKDVLRRAVANRRSGRSEKIELPPERLDLLQPLMNFIYVKVSPAEAIAGGIGYYP